MKKIFILFGLFVCSFSFSQNAERAFTDEMATLGGDVKLIKESVEVAGEKIHKIFEVESMQDGQYFLDTWINIPTVKEKYVEYQIAVNGVLLESTFKPQRGSWQGLALTDAKRSAAMVKLRKGLNKIAVIGDAPLVPTVEFVKLSLNPAKAGISDEKYQAFFEKVKTNSLGIAPQSALFSTPIEGDAAPAVRTGGTNGQSYDYAINMPVYYTTYFYFYWSGGQTVNVSVSTSSFNYYKIDVFQVGVVVPFYSRYIQASYNSNWSFQLSVTDGYYLRICSPSGMTVNITIDGYTFYNCVVTGSGLDMYNQSTDTVSFYTCKIKNGGDPWLFLEGGSGYPGYIVDHNNWGGTTSDGYYWGKANRIKTSENARKAWVSAYYSYIPSFECDVYADLPSVSSKRLSQFNNLASDNSFESAPTQKVPPGSSAYNCFDWSVGEKAPIGHYDQRFQASMDSMYLSRGYIYTVNADSAAIALWKKDNYFTHASVRKNSHKQLPHGFEWESVMGDGNERVMHTRDALSNPPHLPPTDYGSIARYYKPVNGIVNYSLPFDDELIVSTRSNSVQSLLFSDSTEPRFSEIESELLSTLIELIPEKIKAGYDEKYLAWEKSWTRYELYSGDIFYALSDEYDDLVHYCKKYGKAIYPLVFNKVAQRGRYTSNLLRDLTYNRDDSFYDYLASPFKGIPTNLKWDLSQSALVYYCKGLLVSELENIFQSIQAITEMENEAIEPNIVTIGNRSLTVKLNAEKAGTDSVKIFNLFAGWNLNPIIKSHKAVKTFSLMLQA